MVVHTYDPGTWEIKTDCHNLEISLAPRVNSMAAWLQYKTLIQKTKDLLHTK